VAVEDADVVVGEDGLITVARAESASGLRARAGLFSIVPSPPDLIVLKKLGVSNSRVVLSGTITERSTLLEIVQFIATTGWVGELIVIEGETRRSIWFESGMVILAISNSPHERLGEVLYRHGALSRAQFEQAMALLGPTRRIGDVVVQQGWIKPNDLFAMLQKQVREIVFNALAAAGGMYFFARGIDVASAPVRVMLSCSGLLMEAVQRIDEWAYFREKIPDATVVAEAVVGKNADGDASAEKVLAALDGRKNLDEISRVTGLGEFEATKALFALLQSGAARVKKATSPRAQLEEQLDGFNQVLLDIHRTVDSAGVGDGARATLAMFLQGGGAFDVLFANAGPRDDGSFDRAALVGNLQRMHTDDPARVVQQALHDYVAFALFAAGSVLRREDHQVLAKRVQDQLAAIRVSRG
jgi:hypothetical protein